MRFAKALTVFSVMVAASGCGKEVTEAPPVPVKAETVSLREVRPTWRYSGEIRPDVEVRLAFKQTGYVASLHQVKEGTGRLRNVQVGDRVPAGTVLARLRIPEFEAALQSAEGQMKAAQDQLESARADLIQAQAEQTKADQNFQRAEALYAAKAMTRPDYDSAVAQHTQTAAKVDACMKQIEARKGLLAAATGQADSSKITLSEAGLYTPMPSVIVSKEVEPGSLVANGTNGFTVADTRIVKVEFGVPDSMLQQLHVGGAVPVVVEGLQGRKWTGHVSEIAASANRDSRVFNIKVSIPNSDDALKVGMIASVKIEQAGEPLKLPIVPVAALITSQSGSSDYAIFVVSDEGGKQVARLHSVRVGDAIDRSVVINEGLVPGQRIIVERTNQLTDGGAVRVVN